MNISVAVTRVKKIDWERKIKSAVVKTSPAFRPVSDFGTAFLAVFFANRILGIAVPAFLEF